MINKAQLKQLIKEELKKKLTENLDNRKPDDPMRMLADIGIRSEALAKKVREASNNLKFKAEADPNLADPNLVELLREVRDELNMYVVSTHKFRV